MKHAEQKLQTAIVVALRKRFDCFAYHVPNGSAKSPLQALNFRDAGLTAGVPDIVVEGPGSLHMYLEIKAAVQVRERGIASFDRLATLDPAQKEVVARIRGYGTRVAVVDSVEDAVAACEAVGFPPKPKVAPRSEAALATGF